MRLYLRYSLASLLVLLAAACGGNETEGDAGTESEVSPAPSMAVESMQPGGMMDETDQHLQSIGGLSGDSIMRVLPQHRQVVGNMLGQMNREMLDMNMKLDGAWDSAADSLREDLRQMPAMDAAELQAFMPQHVGRVVRLMEAHRKMMNDMHM